MVILVPEESVDPEIASTGPVVPSGHLRAPRQAARDFGGAARLMGEASHVEAMRVARDEAQDDGTHDHHSASRLRGHRWRRDAIS